MGLCDFVRIPPFTAGINQFVTPPVCLLGEGSVNLRSGASSILDTSPK